jgi:hypothetical protein
LIGETIMLRSPVTCAGHGGVCHKCYGDMWKSNEKTHAGICGVLVISEQITQRLLSSKHLLKARPTRVNWPETFSKAFAVERATIMAQDTVTSISVKLDDVEGDDMDDDMLATSIFNYTMDGKIHHVESPIQLYLNNEVWGEATHMHGEITIQPLPETPCFFIPVSNTDLSEALQAIFALIEKEEGLSMHESYIRLIGLLGDTALDTPSVHAEMILRALVRNPNNIIERPDFSGVMEEPEYVMLKMSSAILNSPGVTTSLAFERIRAQLTGTEIFLKKKSGMLDFLFIEKQN